MDDMQSIAHIISDHNFTCQFHKKKKKRVAFGKRIEVLNAIEGEVGILYILT